MAGDAATRILIVDDERHVTNVMRMRFERDGYDVRTANDGESAFDVARDFLPHLVITDFQMPYMSGLELAIALHDAPETESTPVLMVTGRGHKVSPTELARTNVQQVLCKPFSPRELTEHASEILAFSSRSAQSQDDSNREAA